MPLRYVRQLLIVLSTTATLIALPACGEDHIPYGEYRIEWEPHNPALHGQVVRFIEPMAYIVLEQQDVGEYTKEAVEIGRALYTKQTAVEFSQAYRSYVIEDLEEDRWFTIKASYWHRKDWLNSSLTGDNRKLLLEDDRGVTSTMGITTLYDSDREDLVPPQPWEIERQ